MLYIWASGFVCYNQDFVIPWTSLHGCLLEQGSTVVGSWEKMVGLLSTLSLLTDGLFGNDDSKFVRIAVSSSTSTSNR